MMGKGWGIGERLFKDYWEDRIHLFDAIIKGIVMHGAEIWRWNKYKIIEAIQNRYIKWVLKLNNTTPEHIMLFETNRYNVYVDAAKRALKFEEKMLR